MVAWSTSLLDDFRQDSGDNAAVPKIPNEKIQEWYTAALTLNESADVTYALVMVRILRRLMGDARKLIDIRGEVEAETRSQYLKNLAEIMIPMWEELAGLNSNGTIQVGTLNLGIDYTEDDLEAGL